MADFWIKMEGKKSDGISFFFKGIIDQLVWKLRQIWRNIDFKFNRTQTFASSTDVVCRDTVMRTLCDASIDSIWNQKELNQKSWNKKKWWTVY